MKYLIVLVLLAGCMNLEQPPKKVVKYLTNGYLCEELETRYTATVINCENVLTGKKQDIIYNATNIIEIK